MPSNFKPITLRLSHEIEFEAKLYELYYAVPRNRRQAWMRHVLRLGLEASERADAYQSKEQVVGQEIPAPDIVKVAKAADAAPAKAARVVAPMKALPTTAPELTSVSVGGLKGFFGDDAQ